MNYFALLKLVPTIMSIVKEVEALLPEGTGKVKLQKAIDKLAQIDYRITAAIPAVTSLINKVVTFYNAIGTFKHR